MLSVSDNFQIGPSTQQAISITSASTETAVLIPPIADGQGVADHVDINQQNPGPGSGTVVLSQPVADPTQPPANFYEVIATLQQHFQSSAAQNLDASQALSVQLSQARLAELTQATDAIKIAKDNLQNANQALTDKTQELSDAQSSVAEKSGQLELAQTQLTKDEAYLQGVETDRQKYPDDPLVRDKYEFAKAKVEQSQQTVNTAQSDYTHACDAARQAAAGATAAAQTAVDAQNELIRCTDNLISASSATPDVAVTVVQQNKTALAILMECMAKLTEILNKSNQDKLDSDMALYEGQQKKLQDECMAAQADYADKVEKAAHAQKWKKLFGQIASVVFLTVSAVAAVASFGTLSGLVALATVAVMSADIGLDFQGKQTLSSMMTDPVMNKLVEAIANDIRRRKPELTEDQVQMRAGIAALAVIIVTVAAGSAVAKAGINQLATRNPAIQNLLNGFARLGVSAGPNLDFARKVMTYSEAGLAVINSGLQTGSGIIEGIALNEAKKSEAQSALLNAVLAVVKKLIESSIDEYCKSNVGFNLNKHLSQWISINQSTIASITGNFRA